MAQPTTERIDRLIRDHLGDGQLDRGQAARRAIELLLQVTSAAAAVVDEHPQRVYGPDVPPADVEGWSIGGR